MRLMTPLITKYENYSGSMLSMLETYFGGGAASVARLPLPLSIQRAGKRPFHAGISRVSHIVGLRPHTLVA